MRAECTVCASRLTEALVNQQSCQQHSDHQHSRILQRILYLNQLALGLLGLLKGGIRKCPCFRFDTHLIEEDREMGANLRHYLLSDLQGNLFLYLVLYLRPVNQLRTSGLPAGKRLIETHFILSTIWSFSASFTMRLTSAIRVSCRLSCVLICLRKDKI